MVRTFTKIIASIIFLVCTLMSIVIFDQIRKDRLFKKEKLIPPKEFVEWFKDNFERLPTNLEFHTQYEENFATNYHVTNEELEEYQIDVWRGEWSESYVSKTNSFMNTNSEQRFFRTATLIFLLGSIPMFMYLYYYKWKNRQRSI